MKSMIRNGLALTALSSLAVSQVFAAGFEKSVFWDAHYAAIAGAAQSSVQGPQALYWNPAGLAGTEGVQINGDISPTWSKYSGPFATANVSVDSNTGNNYPGAAFVSAGLTPQWGVGVGYYVAAANRSEYDNVPALGNYRADLTMTELSVGTGYELIPGLKLGAAYRIMFVSADLQLASIPATGVHITDISKTAWSGLRVGLDWAPKDSAYGFGLTYRNRVPFVASGNAAIGPNPTSTQPVQVLADLPQRVDAAAHYHFNPDFTGFLGYSFSNYSDERSIGISGINFGLGPQTSNLATNWTNMHNVRLGGEYDGFVEWPIRAGFVWTSQVTPKGNASPLFSAPGPGYTIIAGTGHKFTPNLSTDAAFEYSWDSGTVAAGDVPAGGTAVLGDYSAKAYALHLSATYAF